jgi:glutamyl-tRNA synthetase
MSENIKVRFAPSPTGWLHVGNVRTALVNWLFARQQSGTFVLRIDDTDQERSRPEYEDGIREDLSWLGLAWDEEARQSANMGQYEAAKEKLIAAGRLYACYETGEELDIKRKMLISRGKPPVYDRSSLNLSEAEKAAFEAEGRTPHYRFLLEDKDVVWHDLIRGEVRFTGQFASDPVLIREDGVPLFTFATCVDDGEMGITHILRGEDHVSNSAVQVQIFEALGYAVPQLGHMALLTVKDGKLSKREGGAAIRDLREKGIAPIAVNSYLAKIGTSDAIELASDEQSLVDSFATSKFGRSAATYEEEELLRLNTKWLHQAAYDEVKFWLRENDMDVTPEFWEQIRPNLSLLSDAKSWWEVIETPVTPVIEEPDYCTQAASLLPEAWGADAWPVFVERVKEATGRKGKPLFMPLRLALTARADGPEMPVVFHLLGREKVRRRLLGEVA